MTKTDWTSFGRWHLLFDWLCSEQGHYDNSDLASALCLRSRRSGARDHDAAKRNLRNWRLGKRLPLRRNILVLAELLEVDRDPALRIRWDALYRAEQDQARNGESPIQAPAANEKPPYRFMHAGRASAVAILVGAGLLVGGLAQHLVAANSPTVNEADLPTIQYHARVVLALGASRLVDGVMTGCGQAPPEWKSIRPRLAASSIGFFEDGGLALQMKNSCGRTVVVRAVRFTGHTAGIDELKLLGSYLRLEVLKGKAD